MGVASACRCRCSPPLARTTTTAAIASTTTAADRRSRRSAASGWTRPPSASRFDAVPGAARSLSARFAPPMPIRQLSRRCRSGSPRRLATRSHGREARSAPSTARVAGALFSA